MTQQKTRVDIKAQSLPGKRIPRLLLKLDTAKTGYVDGAWWPHNDDLRGEFSTLLPVVTTRLGPVHRVTYRFGEWAKAPGELEIAGQNVRLEGHRYGTAHTIEVFGARDRRLVLLVVPPYTDAHHAFAAMTFASATNNTSTVNELLTA